MVKVKVITEIKKDVFHKFWENMIIFIAKLPRAQGISQIIEKSV